MSTPGTSSGLGGSVFYRLTPSWYGKRAPAMRWTRLAAYNALERGSVVPGRTVIREVTAPPERAGIGLVTLSVIVLLILLFWLPKANMAQSAPDGPMWTLFGCMRGSGCLYVSGPYLRRGQCEEAKTFYSSGGVFRDTSTPARPRGGFTSVPRGAKLACTYGIV